MADNLKMKAIELSGIHVGRLVTVSWKTKGNRTRTLTRKITMLRHYPKGDVVLLQSTYPSMSDRIPFDADVEFLN